MTTGQRAPHHETPGLMRNAVTLTGTVLATVSIANIVFLFLVQLLGRQSSPYLGILTFLVLPAFLVLGLLLIPLGAWLERRKRRQVAPSQVPRFPRIDLNVPAQRAAFEFFIMGTVLFVLLTAFGTYRGYEFTESVQFCGLTCHSVMKPEYTTYKLSPHARVRCVDCHVGPGASWYVRSKLSGTYQVYATIFHKYPRPIETPIYNLRPAQETCEQCHWPSKFYGAQLKVFYHYAPDEQNTPRQIRMLINIGGAEPAAGVPSGIHWHMNIANQITFIATDRQRQVIPWVQIKDSQGRVTVYQDKDAPLTAQQIQQASKHRMDCIDCHDRPSHIFTPPDEAVDESLLAGRIDPSLPFIKEESVALLTAGYTSTPKALQAIARSVPEFYKKKYPAIYAGRQQAIGAAVAELDRIYQSTIFPEMKVDWRTHPNNIGHFYTPGCFRCHDGKHVSPDGKVISKSCTTCHTVLDQTESGVPLMRHEPGVAFRHPVDIGDLTQVTCSDCHTGAAGL